MIWHSQTSVHNPMFDGEGRIWLTARIRAPQTPAFCRKGSDLPSAKLFPMSIAQRQAVLFDPKTDKITYIDLCFTTHHMAFAEDADNTLWFSAGGARAPVIGWLNTKMFLETGDAAKWQGWTPFILDTNGNGKRDEGYVEPNQPVDPTKDKRILAGLYGIGYDPSDGTIWGSVLATPGGVVHVIPGSDPPATTLTEYYQVPFNEPKAPVNGFGPRGMDIDRNGVVWVPLASGHLASFDRKKCKGPLNGPNATGRHCPEGWTLYQFPGPQFEGLDQPGAAESSYYAWADQFDTFGLGRNVPIATGNMSDSLEALVTESSSPCVSPIRWASTPRGSTGASTIRTAAGRAGGCGLPTRAARPTTSKAVRARPARSCISSFARTRSRDEGHRMLTSPSRSRGRSRPQKATMGGT
jgi:hypothetical protein